MCESLGITNSSTGILTRMSDKFSRLVQFFKQGRLEVTNEKIEDTAQDFTNYLFLLVMEAKDRGDSLRNKSKVCIITKPLHGDTFGGSMLGVSNESK